MQAPCWCTRTTELSIICTELEARREKRRRFFCVFTDRRPHPSTFNDNLIVLRAAILMYTDTMLSDLRSIRTAKTLEEAQTPINRKIDRVNAHSDAAERAGVEKDSAGTE
jgi:hypothetical protein